MTAKSALVKISHAMFFSRTSLLVLNRSFWDLTCSGWWRYQHNTNWWNQQALWQQHIWQIWKMLFADSWYLCMRCVSVKIKCVGANNPTSGRFSCSGISSRGLEACHQLSDWELWDDKNLELLWFTNFLEKSLRNVDLTDAILSVDCQEKKQAPTDLCLTDLDRILGVERDPGAHHYLVPGTVPIKEENG